MKNLRPPVVVVVGHVDHGKTSLLDAIRKTSVTKKEAGGITQSIGASVAQTKDGKKITFIDTPGHAFFANMRSRGVSLADIAILVVSADDGVKPQTKEALNLLLESKTPFVVAITKIDLASANIENVLTGLEKEGVYFEKRGGEISYLGVSSKTGEGITELLDLISLVSEINEIGKNENNNLSGFVIETTKDKRGLLVSIIVKSGQVKKSDIIYAGSIKAKVKGLFDEAQKQIPAVNAGFPAQVLGFDELPKVGSQISSEPVLEKEISRKERKDSEAKIKIFLKAKTSGSLEALLANIPSGVEVIGSGVGDVIESDIFLSKAAGAQIFLFEAKYSSVIRKLAETEDVKIENFAIIYDLIARLEELINSGKEEISGEAQIIASFPFDGKKVAGSHILKGIIKVKDKLRLVRGGKILGEVKIISLRKQKEEIGLAKQGEECGILFEPQLDFSKGDMLVSFTNK